MTLQPVDPDSITPDPQNTNNGTERGMQMLETSLRKLGAGRSIVVDANRTVIAGNHTFEAAQELGLPMIEVETDGTTLVVVRRTDLDMSTDPRARQLAIADNRTAQVGIEFNSELVVNTSMQVDLSDFFSETELQQLTRRAELEQTSAADTPPQSPKQKDDPLKLIQLYYQPHEADEFEQLVHKVAKRLGVATMSLAVLGALRQAAIEA